MMISCSVNLEEEEEMDDEDKTGISKFLGTFWGIVWKKREEGIRGGEEWESGGGGAAMGRAGDMEIM